MGGNLSKNLSEAKSEQEVIKILDKVDEPDSVNFTPDCALSAARLIEPSNLSGVKRLFQVMHWAMVKYKIDDEANATRKLYFEKTEIVEGIFLRFAPFSFCKGEPLEMSVLWTDAVAAVLSNYNTPATIEIERSAAMANAIAHIGEAIVLQCQERQKKDASFFPPMCSAGDSSAAAGHTKTTAIKSWTEIFHHVGHSFRSQSVAESWFSSSSSDVGRRLVEVFTQMAEIIVAFDANSPVCPPTTVDSCMDTATYFCSVLRAMAKNSGPPQNAPNPMLGLFIRSNLRLRAAFLKICTALLGRNRNDRWTQSLLDNWLGLVDSVLVFSPDEKGGDGVVSLVHDALTGLVLVTNIVDVNSSDNWGMAVAAFVNNNRDAAIPVFASSSKIVTCFVKLSQAIIKKNSSSFKSAKTDKKEIKNERMIQGLGGAIAAICGNFKNNQSSSRHQHQMPLQLSASPLFTDIDDCVRECIFVTLMPSATQSPEALDCWLRAAQALGSLPAETSETVIPTSRRILYETGYSVFDLRFKRGEWPGKSSGSAYTLQDEALDMQENLPRWVSLVRYYVLADASVEVLTQVKSEYDRWKELVCGTLMERVQVSTVCPQEVQDAVRELATIIEAIPPA